MHTASDVPEQTYECAWAPFSESREPTDWVNLTKSQVIFPNTQLHKVKGASICFFVSTVESMPSRKALYLINVDNTFEVDSKFHPKDQNPIVPTVVVTKKVGAALSELNPRAVEVKLELKEAAAAEEVFKQEKDSQHSGENFDCVHHIFYLLVNPSFY